MPATSPRLPSCLPWTVLRYLAPMSLALALVLALAPGAAAAPASPSRAGQAAVAPQGGIRIVAVVNGDVISNVDVDDRVRLFALSTGQPLNPDVLDRLRPQIRRQLVDEMLQLQEIQRRHIVIQDKQIAEAIRSIEGRNGMQPGMLRQKLSAGGIGFRTLVDQIRNQLGWVQVVREQLGTAGRGYPRCRRGAAAHARAADRPDGIPGRGDFHPGRGPERRG